MATTIGPPELEVLLEDTEREAIILIQAVWQLTALLINPWPPSDAPVAIKTLVSTIPPLARDVLANAAVLFTKTFPGVHNLWYTLITQILGPMATEFGHDYDALIQSVLDAFNADLVASKVTDPADVDDVAAQALTGASVMGLGARLVTMMFELFVPKKLNFMNWLGPSLATLAGYEDIVAKWRGPILEAAIGNFAKYNANQEYLTVAPPAQMAQNLFARGLLTAAQRDQLVGWSGVMPAFQAPTQAGAYRPAPPFLLARAAEIGAIPPTDLTSALTFAGFRPADITMLENAYAALALLPYQQQYLVAAVRSTELGTMTPADLTSSMNDIKLSQDQQALVQLTVATRKLEQLAELYRKSIDEAYKYGTITDAQYVPSLEAIGIGAADAQAHYAIASILKTGKALAAAVKVEARLAAQQTRAAMNAAVASFKAGTIDADALEAALLALGVDPAVASAIVVVQTERALGAIVHIYGVALARGAAILLREKVVALGAQVKSQLVAPADALTTLASLGIPAANAQALVADWAASHITAADVGVLLPL